MAFLVDEAHLPAIVTVGPMTDEAFAQLCAEHPDLNLELSALGELIIMPRTYTWTGARNGEIMGQLHHWARQDKRGVAFDSSTGWLLPNTARRSPDAAWIFNQAPHKRPGPGRLQPLLARVPELCDRVALAVGPARCDMGDVAEKMSEWLANGAQLGWLIDPDARIVEIYFIGPASRPRRAAACRPWRERDRSRDSCWNLRRCGTRWRSKYPIAGVNPTWSGRHTGGSAGPELRGSGCVRWTERSECGRTGSPGSFATCSAEASSMERDSTKDSVRSRRMNS